MLLVNEDLRKTRNTSFHSLDPISILTRSNLPEYIYPFELEWAKETTMPLHTDCLQAAHLYM